MDSMPSTVITCLVFVLRLFIDCCLVSKHTVSMSTCLFLLSCPALFCICLIVALSFFSPHMCFSLSFLMLFYLVLSFLFLSYLVLSCLVFSGFLLSCVPFLVCLVVVLSCFVLSCIALPCLVRLALSFAFLYFAVYYLVLSVCVIFLWPHLISVLVCSCLVSPSSFFLKSVVSCLYLYL